MSKTFATPEAMDGAAAAHFCGVARSTWLKLHSAAGVPRPVRIGRRVLWLRGELLAWLEAGCPARDRWDAMRRPAGVRR